MKVLLFGNDAHKLKNKAIKAGLEVVEEKSTPVWLDKPDVVVSFGGDGTFLQAEAVFPYIPKIILKNSRICKLCIKTTPEKAFLALKNKKYKVEKLPKIEVIYGKEKLVAVNDIVVHNKDPRHGMRYKVWIDGGQVNTEIIGDGVVVATPLGSSGYYRSITDSIFETGLGLAFNNSTEQSDHMVLNENRIIEIEITRGPVHVFADNQTKYLVVEEGERIKIKKHKTPTKIIRMI
ncbi:hypothetical protein COW81_02340 [Candidatus Campbellbacteria bacterium CG22_combo_CG10-13_8_21_14_all_36_13]|uniref:NAD(+) kinase n=1 Tax=Candidatus Campbellbacteria bacterium CG22_combo_CG10-13_8_21_14_all_36_13 TaxID=1974529 RepID=A0A2H0DY05_9BACT|nr:MAG: hypothetical protein COW81_02340 [Candidatus Campbellbacteria bacterium CG22_combo_CG10-13_8_21_14_all_36_13]